MISGHRETSPLRIDGPLLPTASYCRCSNGGPLCGYPVAHDRLERERRPWQTLLIPTKCTTTVVIGMITSMSRPALDPIKIVCNSGTAWSSTYVVIVPLLDVVRRTLTRTAIAESATFDMPTELLSQLHQVGVRPRQSCLRLATILTMAEATQYLRPEVWNTSGQFWRSATAMHPSEGNDLLLCGEPHSYAGPPNCTIAPSQIVRLYFLRDFEMH